MPSCNITFMALSNPSEAVIYCFSDASLGNLEDGSTQGGYINFLGSKDGSMVSPLSWRSHRHKRVVRSTLAGETLACSGGVDSALQCQKLLKDIWGVNIPIVCLTDSKSLVNSVYSQSQVSEKALRIELWYLKSLISQGILSFKWIGTNLQLADSLTKNCIRGRVELSAVVKNNKLPKELCNLLNTPRSKDYII